MTPESGPADPAAGQDGGNRRWQAESHRAGFAAAVRPYVRADPIHLPQNLTSVPVENAAGCRRHNPLRASEQELGIQFELEVGDLLT